MPTTEFLLASPSWRISPGGDRRAWAPLPSFADAALEAGPADAALASLAGHWALACDSGGSTLLAVDRMRSLGLLYAFDGTRWIVSDEVGALLARLASPRLDVEQARIFESYGYALGEETLIEGVFSVEAGSIVELRPDGSRIARSFAGYRRPADPIEDPADFAVAFSAALDATVGRMLDAAGERPLVLPLSGGLDSRLLLARLARLGATRVSAFTYGKAGAGEIGVSKRVAEAFGVPWTVVDYPPDRMRALWAGDEGEAFRRANWCGVSLPHVQDWFALREMSGDGRLPEDAILLPGHTIVGNSHDEGLALSGPPAARLARIIARHHAQGRGADRLVDSSASIARAVERAAREVGYDGSGPSALSWLEWFNLRERQAKYINHSMRAYEFFGRTWAAPMLDVEMWATWLDGSVALTKNREWYARFVAEEVARSATGDAPAVHAPSNDHGMPPALKRATLAAMRATGADALLSRSRSIRTMLDHPMSFEAFSAPLSPLAQAGAHLAGESSTSLWSRLFVANSWGSSVRILPERDPR